MRRGLSFVGLSLLLCRGCAARAAASTSCAGRSLAVDPGRQEITIKHDDIHGFMPGMTMPFKVSDARLLTGGRRAIWSTATLVVEDDDGLSVSRSTTTGHAALTEPPPPPDDGRPRAGRSGPGRAARRTKRARRDRLSDWRGRVLAVTFIYTRCPLPDFCPLMDRHFAAVQRAIVADAAAARPGRAAVDQLRSGSTTRPPCSPTHARQAGADPRVWRFATGDARRDRPLRVDGSASPSFRDGSEPGAASPTTCAPRSSTPDGRLATILNGNDWTPADLLDAARHAAIAADAWPTGAIAPPLSAFTPAERRVIASAADARRGPAIPERAALQHRAAARGRDAAQLPRRRPPRHRALPRSGAHGGGDPRAARMAAAGL